MKIKFLEENKHKLSEFTRRPEDTESLEEFLETFDMFYIERFNMFCESGSYIFDNIQTGECAKLSRKEFIEFFRSSYEYCIEDGQMFNSSNYKCTLHGNKHEFEDVSPAELDSWVDEWEHYHIELQLALCELFINKYENRFSKYIKN